MKLTYCFSVYIIPISEKSLLYTCISLEIATADLCLVMRLSVDIDFITYCLCNRL